MKKQILFIAFFLICGICQGQNLVPNPSFEVFDTCPDSEAQIERAIPWKNFGGSILGSTTPDYYNSCAPQGNWSVPVGGACYQFAATGVAFAAIVTFAFTNYREFIGIQLIQPLTIGTKYYYSFKAVLAEANGHSCPSNKIGIRFSTNQYSLNSPLIADNFAHSYSDSILNDSINWTVFKGEIIMDSAYNYLIIGNFFDNINTDTIKYNSSTTYSYYLIDDVCLSIDSLACNSTVEVNEHKDTDNWILFPNPFTNELNITVKEHDAVELIIYDLTGRIIINHSFRNSAVVKTGHLAKGLYLYEVRSREGILKTGKIVKTELLYR